VLQLLFTSSLYVKKINSYFLPKRNVSLVLACFVFWNEDGCRTLYSYKPGTFSWTSVRSSLDGSAADEPVLWPELLVPWLPTLAGETGGHGWHIVNFDKVKQLVFIYFLLSFSYCFRGQMLTHIKVNILSRRVVFYIRRSTYFIFF
jgi:hypothetical protein